jgi:tetratricopeptide (TPR) repeat protein
MGIRFRRSMKILPGVRLTVGKSSVGISAGVRGARVSLNSSGRVTTSAGIPGSGLYWTESKSLRKKKSKSKSLRTVSSTRVEETIVDDEVYVEDVYTPPARALDAPVSIPQQPAKSHIFSSKEERALSALFQDIYGDQPGNLPALVFEKTRALAAEHPELALAMQAIQVLHGSTNEELQKESFVLADSLWPQRDALFSHELVQKYFPGITPGVMITPGIFANERYNMKALGLIYAEILQVQGNYAKALEVVEEIDSDQMTAISVADLELALLKFDDAIATTEDIENEDDATAMLLVLRGIAFREKGFFDASLECLKQAVAKKSRSEGILNRGLWERSFTYERMGKKALAKKDLEKIMSREPSYDGLNERLALLNA